MCPIFWNMSWRNIKRNLGWLQIAKPGGTAPMIWLRGSCSSSGKSLRPWGTWRCEPCFSLTLRLHPFRWWRLNCGPSRLLWGFSARVTPFGRVLFDAAVKRINDRRTIASTVLQFLHNGGTSTIHSLFKFHSIPRIERFIVNLSKRVISWRSRGQKRGWRCWHSVYHRIIFLFSSTANLVCFASLYSDDSCFQC